MTEPPHIPRTGRPAKAPTGVRVAAGVIALGCLAVLSVGAMLSPDSEGHGTHTQLGMPECAWAATLDQPCLTCGMTTSFSHAGHGDFVASFLTQPMGFLLVLGAATTFWGGAHVAATGSQLTPYAERILTKRGLIILATLTGAAWVYKIITWTGM